MIEVFKHLIGGCGEPHLNLLHLIPFIMGPIYLLKHNIKWCWNKGCSLCVKHLKLKKHDN